MDILRSLLGRLVTDYANDRVQRIHTAHANHRKPGEPPPTSAYFGWGTKTLVLVACSIMVSLSAIMVWSIASGRPIDNAWFGALFFSAVAIWLCIACYDGFIRRIEWNEAEVRFRKWNGERLAPWEDIVGIEEKSYPPHLRIAFRDGKGFAIVETMKGSRYFMHLVERRLTPDPSDNATGNKRRRRRQRGKKR